MENAERILWKLPKEFQKETENARRILKKKKKKEEVPKDAQKDWIYNHGYTEGVQNKYKQMDDSPEKGKKTDRKLDFRYELRISHPSNPEP